MNILPAQILNFNYFGFLLALVFLSTGCVTESSGGLPPPGTKDQRVDAHLALARGYLELADLDSAREPLANALDIDPRNVEAQILTAVLLQAEGEFELAEEHYKKALRIDPRNAQALNNYGVFLYARGRYADALVPLTKLVKDTSYRARSQAFESLGLANLAAGDKAAAQAAFERSLELNFRQPRSTLELAEIAYARGDYAIASARLLEYKTMAQPNPRSLCLHVKVATALGDADQVASQSLALKNLFPKQADQCQAKS